MARYGMFTDEGAALVAQALDEWEASPGIRAAYADWEAREEAAYNDIRDVTRRVLAAAKAAGVDAGEVTDTAVREAIDREIRERLEKLHDPYTYKARVEARERAREVAARLDGLGDVRVFDDDRESVILVDTPEGDRWLRLEVPY